MKGKHFTYNQLAVISTAINIELQEDLYYENYPDFLINIVKHIPFRSKLTSYLMMTTLLRYSDIKKINLKHLMVEKSQLIIQTKTSKSIRISCCPTTPLLISRLLNFQHLKDTLSYSAFIGDIKQQISNSVILRSQTFKRKSHIFRHVEASFLYQRGYTIEYIARLLGDEPSTVLNSYIHSSINELFLI